MPRLVFIYVFSVWLCCEASFFCGEGPPSRSYGRTAALRLIVRPLWRKERWSVFYIFQVMEHRWNAIDKGKPKHSGKKCLSATLSTNNPTWNDPGLRSQRPTTNRLSHGTAEASLIPRKWNRMNFGRVSYTQFSEIIRYHRNWISFCLFAFPLTNLLSNLIRR
jgi:hypothetical protein